MIPLEGTVLQGLDEFMLRLGHLKVLCRTCREARGSWKRIINETAETLTSLVPVPPQDNNRIAYYLFRKRLCPTGGINSYDSERFRYPDLIVQPPTASSPAVLTAKAAGAPAIWWQDMCLASPSIRSRVGGVSATAKAGSKTALSHISDWSMLLDLITAGGELTHTARLLVQLDENSGSSEAKDNPYLLGFDRLVFATQVLREDFDLFARLAPKLILAQQPIRKANGRALFAQTIQEIAIEAETSRLLSSNRQFRIFQQARELEKAAEHARKDIGSTSTAWHRAASRLETYVDLGLLEKGRGGEDETYEYVYYATSGLNRAVKYLSEADTTQDWIERHLVSAIFDVDTDTAPLSEIDLKNWLNYVVRALAIPSRVYPIDTIAQGLAWLSLKENRPISLGAARESIENFARSRPEAARLSRGTIGDRAEFVSFNNMEILI